MDSSVGFLVRSWSFLWFNVVHCATKGINRGSFTAYYKYDIRRWSYEAPQTSKLDIDSCVDCRSLPYCVSSIQSLQPLSLDVFDCIHTKRPRRSCARTAMLDKERTRTATVATLFCLTDCILLSYLESLDCPTSSIAHTEYVAHVPQHPALLLCILLDVPWNMSFYSTRRTKNGNSPLHPLVSLVGTNTVRTRKEYGTKWITKIYVTQVRHTSSEFQAGYTYGVHRAHRPTSILFLTAAVPDAGKVFWAKRSPYICGLLNFLVSMLSVVFAWPRRK